MRDEELAGAGIEVVAAPWHDGAARQKIARELIADRKIATDSDNYGLPLPGLPGDFNELRWALTDEEVARYREGAKRASRAMETACKSLKRGMSEHEAGGILDLEIRRASLNPVVTLVASDERIRNFRHPIPKDKKIDNLIMLVTCADYTGLITSLTRFVAFAPLTDEHKTRQQTICNIDAAVNLATKPGRPLGEIFDVLAEAYHDAGHVDEWKNHHQGGSCGYGARDIVAVPGSSVRAMENQAFAWNPSVPGAKSEDTILCTAKGIAIVSAHSNDWPTVTGKSKAGELRRAGILVA
jgi:Xaa-Pro dipeptidase